MSIGTLYKRALETVLVGQAKVYNYSDKLDFAALWEASPSPSEVPSLLSVWAWEHVR